MTPAEAVAAARRERDVAICLAEDADITGWDKKLIDQAIDAFARQGRPFSANDVRELLPDVRPALMGARFLAAANRGDIRPVGLVSSTKRTTHAKRIALWVRAVNHSQEAATA